jgi:hypothetical protein
MTIATPCDAAQKNTAPVFACNLKTFSSADRPRYDVLVQRIRGAMRDRMETCNGYVFKLDSKTVTLPEVAEWMGMERLCCPFLTLQLAASGNQANWLLTLTGPEGVKSLLDAEFPAL